MACMSASHIPDIGNALEEEMIHDINYFGVLELIITKNFGFMVVLEVEIGMVSLLLSLSMHHH